MTERESDLFKMVEQVLEIKQKRIDTIREGLKEELLAAHLTTDDRDMMRVLGNPENIKRLTEIVEYLEENKKKFRQSLYDTGLLVDELKVWP